MTRNDLSTEQQDLVRLALEGKNVLMPVSAVARPLPSMYCATSLIPLSRFCTLPITAF